MKLCDRHSSRTQNSADNLWHCVFELTPAAAITLNPPTVHEIMQLLNSKLPRFTIEWKPLLTQCCSIHVGTARRAVNTTRERAQTSRPHTFHNPIFAPVLLAAEVSIFLPGQLKHLQPVACTELNYRTAITHNDDGLRVSVYRSSIACLPTSDRLHWDELSLCCLTSSERKKKKRSKGKSQKRNLKQSCILCFYATLFAFWSFMAKFHRWAECERRCFVSSASPLWTPEPSSGFQLTELGAELLTLSPLSLSSSLSLPSLSWSLFSHPLPFWIPTYDVIHVDVS